ncbi:MAG: hypothetical protein MJZ68_09155 [archaeon]|nr:hypothetical protein [archaeon]
MNPDLGPNAALFGQEEEQSEEEKAVEYVYGKNPNRVSALSDLMFENLKRQIESMNLPNDEAKLKMAFKMTATAILDMLADSQHPETAPDMMSDFDMFIGVALTNFKFKVNLFEEQKKALQAIDREQFKSDEDYVQALSNAEDLWWDIAQPLLNGRNPADAIRETVRKYGLE